MTRGGTTTVFIGTQYLRDNTIINDNVDAKVLQPIIRMAQDKYIQETIGTSLYDKMLVLVDAANPALPTPVLITGNYKILLEEYIMPTLIQYCIYESIPYMNFKFRNKSISKQSSDNSTPADLTELYYIRDNVSSMAQFYAERLRNYLCQNASLFPEFRSGNEDISPNPNISFSGIHIPRVPLNGDNYLNNINYNRLGGNYNV